MKIFTLAVVLVILFVLHSIKNPTKYWVINLRRNRDRLDNFMRSASELPVERFDAVCGKNLTNIERYMTRESYAEMIRTERRAYRTKHYQQTRGGVGCYMSHYTLIKRLLGDPFHRYYVIFEDDVSVLPGAEKAIKDAIANAPSDWDMILFSNIMERPGLKGGNEYVRKLDHFWGLQGYVVNKRGSEKIVRYAGPQANIQIDSKLSLLAQRNQLNVYTLQNRNVIRNESLGTTIQDYDVLNGSDNAFVIEDI